jgi:hypothetical protein
LTIKWSNMVNNARMLIFIPHTLIIDKYRVLFIVDFCGGLESHRNRDDKMVRPAVPCPVPLLTRVRRRERGVN